MKEREEYKVEKVLDSRWWCRTLQYMVKWVGYPREESLWVKESEMGKARGKVCEFHQRFPAAPQP